MVVAFIDAYRERFGVEPICRVLCEHEVQLAPSSYYAHRSRRRQRGRSVTRGYCEIRRVHASLDHVPPLEYETEYHRHNDPAQQSLAERPSLH